jgi:acetoin utilization protein AcuC
MFVTQRAAKTRDLLLDLGLLDGNCGTEVSPYPATITQMRQFHSARYLKALQQAAAGNLTRQGRSMGLGTIDCPVFRDMFAYAALACGATLTGAELILSGKTDIAFNLSGGFHHAKAGKASGFSYINDVVLACLRFMEKGKRVLYLDVDAHHGDGVQEAFYSSNKALIISLHESGRTLWPWTGFIHEIGAGPGKGYNINIPLPLGICDECYLDAFKNIVLPLTGAYNPDVIVLQLGMDALAGDPLAHLELTNNAHAEIIERLLRFNKPILATGGGGYHVDNTVRGWALAWKVICGRGADSDFPMGLGGVMLQSMDWPGGLRDHVLPTDDQHCKIVQRNVSSKVRFLTRHVFPYHGI